MNDIFILVLRTVFHTPFQSVTLLVRQSHNVIGSAVI